MTYNLQDERINILFIETGTSGGGSFESLYQHLRVIDRERYHPVVVFLNKTRYLSDIKEKLGIPVYLLKDPLLSKDVPRIFKRAFNAITWVLDRYLSNYYLFYIRMVQTPLINKICSIIENEEIDLIHLNTQIQRDLFGVFVARRANLPCISHLRSSQSGNFNNQRAVLCNKFINIFIANSQSLKTYWVNKGIDGKKTSVVYNAIPSIYIDPVDIGSKWQIGSETKCIIGCVGRLEWRKGHNFLIEAYKLFREIEPQSVVLIVGDGYMKNELIQTVLNMGLEENIVFTGNQKNVFEIMASLDMLVVPSKEEAFGRVIIEGMQAGTPVIAANVGGIPEIVEHEKDGLLVDFNDVEGLSRAMYRLHNDQQLRLKLIENGRQTIKERFSIDRYTMDLDGIYERVLKEKTG